MTTIDLTIEKTRRANVEIDLPIAVLAEQLFDRVAAGFLDVKIKNEIGGFAFKIAAK